MAGQIFKIDLKSEYCFSMKIILDKNVCIRPMTMNPSVNHNNEKNPFFVCFHGTEICCVPGNEFV